MNMVRAEFMSWFYTFDFFEFVEDGVNISRRCPKCNGEMYMSYYVAKWNILRKRTWHCCKSCSYACDVDKFKKELLCR